MTVTCTGVPFAGVPIAGVSCTGVSCTGVPFACVSFACVSPTVDINTAISKSVRKAGQEDERWGVRSHA